MTDVNIDMEAFKPPERSPKCGDYYLFDGDLFVLADREVARASCRFVLMDVETGYYLTADTVEKLLAGCTYVPSVKIVVGS